MNRLAALPPSFLARNLPDLDRRRHSPKNEEDAKLTRVEKDALLFIADFYPAHPLPPV